MKNFPVLLIAGILMVSCSSSKEVSSSKAENKSVEKAVVKQAIESRQYVIRMNKIINKMGGSADLKPENNFFILNGEYASVSLPYVGRSFHIRPISGLNFNGHTVEYKMQNDQDKGVYNIQIEVESNGTRFDFYLNIGNTGTCSISVTHPYIDSVSYYGDLVPLSQMKEPEIQKTDRI